MPPALYTPRLELVAATAALAKADCEGNAPLARALGVQVPASWPLEAYDAQVRAFFAATLGHRPWQSGWWGWFWIRREGRLLVGSGGFKGPPSAGGGVELGYAVLPEHQKQGYASEAAAALVAWALAQPGVHHVAAEAHPHNAASRRVLEKCGLRYLREGDEPGTLRYLRAR
jgi:[ribosomal protein S5]-alanine N-acetyltransferase